MTLNIKLDILVSVVTNKQKEQTMSIFKKIKEFFNEPDQMELIEERFYKKLEDMNAHPEKYQHILNKNSAQSKIPPVSLF